MDGMTGREIVLLVNKYIGVSADGYLGDFTYRSHKKLYPLFCNLDIDPAEIKGSTRTRLAPACSATNSATWVTVPSGSRCC